MNRTPFNRHGAARLRLAWLLLLLFSIHAMPTLLVRAQQAATAAAAAPASAKTTLTPFETELANGISLAAIKQTTAELAADAMQGRGTMQAGGDKAAQYIADRFKQLGLQPGGKNDAYFQPIGFRETVFAPETSFTIGKTPLVWATDYAIQPPIANRDVNGEMVFVAYGWDFEQLKRKDIGDFMVNGKIVVLLEGPPANVDKASWKKFKVQRAIIMNLVRSGAKAIVFVEHGREERSYAEMHKYFIRRQIERDDETPLPDYVPPFVSLSKTGAEKIFAAAGMTYQEAVKRADEPDFRPFKLKQDARIIVKLKRKTGKANNVVGVLEGSDPQLKQEAVVFTAHYDAFGMEENGRIYHGAADNALGVAEMLAAAETFAKAPTRPKRSLVFLAVTGEEYGLYGSEYWAKNPTWNIKKVAANLNLDGMGTEVYAPVKTIVGFGAEHSTLGSVMSDVAGALGLQIIPDPMPDEKAFYRSDHYAFVKKGVPGLMILGAPAGEPQAWIKRMKEWEKDGYHDESDIIKPDWVWEGPRTVAQLMTVIGWRIGNEPQMPAWLPSSPFYKYERGTDKEPPPES